MEPSANLILTHNQKLALVLVHMAATPLLALEDTRGDMHLVAAVQMLQQLDAIDIVDEGGIQVTDTGIALMKDAALLDDSDQLTKDAMAMVSQSAEDDTPAQYTEQWQLIGSINNLLG